MSEVNLYKMDNTNTIIEQLKVKREWMDNTWEAHAYKCFPVTLTNSLGFGVAFPEDIEFIWDGISDTTADHVKILKGERYAYTGRGNATISFHSGFKIETDENTSILHMPVPNQFIDGVQAFTTIISTSFYKSPMPIAMKITRPNVPILIPAGEPVVALVPFSVKASASHDINIYNFKDKYGPEYFQENKRYGDKSQEINQSGGWTNFYRNATNEEGVSIGAHELKAIKLNIIDHTK